MTKKRSKGALVPVNVESALVARLKKEFEYKAAGGLYIVYSVDGELLAKTDFYNLAVAKNPSGQLGLVMIAARPESNTVVDRHRRILQTLQRLSDQINEEAEGFKPNYGAFVPRILDVIDSEDGRHGVFMGYHDSISSYKQLVPLSIALATTRVDMQSAAWMLGKLLKLADFVHSCGFTVGLVDTSNVFIETQQHGVVVMDFTDASEEAEDSEMLLEVMHFAEIIWWAVGGSATEEPPYDASIMTRDQHAKFTTLLKRLMSGGVAAHEAHALAYALFDEIWPKTPMAEAPDGMKRDFHPYTTYPR
jgi:hypothetical protein